MKKLFSKSDQYTTLKKNLKNVEEELKRNIRRDSLSYSVMVTLYFEFSNIRSKKKELNPQDRKKFQARIEDFQKKYSKYGFGEDIEMEEVVSLENRCSPELLIKKSPYNLRSSTTHNQCTQDCKKESHMPNPNLEHNSASFSETSPNQPTSSQCKHSSTDNKTEQIIDIDIEKESEQTGPISRAEIPNIIYENETERKRQSKNESRNIPQIHMICYAQTSSPPRQSSNKHSHADNASRRITRSLTQAIEKQNQEDKNMREQRKERNPTEHEIETENQRRMPSKREETPPYETRSRKQYHENSEMKNHNHQHSTYDQKEDDSKCGNHDPSRNNTDFATRNYQEDNIRKQKETHQLREEEDQISEAIEASEMQDPNFQFSQENGQFATIGTRSYSETVAAASKPEISRPNHDSLKNNMKIPPQDYYRDNLEIKTDYSTGYEQYPQLNQEYEYLARVGTMNYSETQAGAPEAAMYYTISHTESRGNLSHSGPHVHRKSIHEQEVDNRRSADSQFYQNEGWARRPPPEHSNQDYLRTPAGYSSKFDEEDRRGTNGSFSPRGRARFRPEEENRTHQHNSEDWGRSRNEIPPLQQMVKCQNREYNDPAPEVVEEEPVEIFDVHQYFQDDLDLNALSGSIGEQIETIRTWATTFETAVCKFSGAKYSLEYFVLDEKLMRLIEHLDRLKCQNDEITTKRKIDVIVYIKGLHTILDSKAEED